MSDSFNTRKERAIEELLKMQESAPAPTNPPQKPPMPPKNSSPLGIDIPILSRLKADGDLTLVLGLMLLLLNEKADKRLLFALLYILL